ncbi:MAG: serine hydrolase [Gemmatimonadaceae bacterium]
MKLVSTNHLVLAVVCVGAAGCATVSTSSSPHAGPGVARALAYADSAVAAGVGVSYPGAVLVVTRDGKIVHERAFGFAYQASGDIVINGDGTSSTFAVQDKSRPMKTSTVFDLASVTKVMATTFAMMTLVDHGKVDLDAPVHKYLPDFRGPQLDSITPRHLLQHSAGLAQWQPLYYQASTTAQTYSAIRDMPLQWGVGEARHYSDLGFMILGDIVEHVSSQRLDVFVDSALYKPLGLRKTTFNPKLKGMSDFAATEQGNGYEKHMVYDTTFAYKYRGDPTAWNGWRDRVLIGEVNDGNSFYANGGIAGHAGLFSTGAELSVLMEVLLNGGSYAGRSYITRDVVDRFLTLDKYQNFLGWQHPAQMPDGTLAHTGFTGTYVFGDPRDHLSIVLLTNKQGRGTDANGLFPNLGPLQTAVVKAILSGIRADAARAGL